MNRSDPSTNNNAVVARTMPPSSSSEGGLGQALIGEKIVINTVSVSVKELIGEGRFRWY